MARSFGDLVAAQVGVICDPEIWTFSIENDDKFILIGSDGLFEFLKHKEIVNMIVPYIKKGELEKGVKKVINSSY